MPTFTISRNGAGVTSKKLVTDLPADFVKDALKQSRIAHTARECDGYWSIKANRGEEAMLSEILRTECKRIEIKEAKAEAAAQAGNVIQLHPSNGDRRVLVEARKHSVGDVFGGRVITGLGRVFASNPDQLAANGIGPWVDYVQYAYFD
ncbi:hypothetical protein M5E06_17805 [Azospirillum sp. A1-3]|uniref:hypothetical protein n=1 Tax=Azospirillum sp. A1-3 TaxID=185874 RepID=UPI0020772252|nr:hypothetical protein [Azospirillum sp. A1-3]MCM8735991.1 hypothetical protein [Azospirillum sp. A1-3]